MTFDSGHEPVIEIDRDLAPIGSRRPLPRPIRVVVVLVTGVLIGMSATTVAHEPAASQPVVSPRMHRVVVTADGVSETFSMPTGSVVSVPPVRNSCSITVDGQFVASMFGVMGAECGATVW